MTKILMPVEDKRYGEAQAAFLSRHEFPEDTELTLMTVIKPLAVQDYGFAVPAAYLEAIAKEDERIARQLLSEIEATLKNNFPEMKIRKLMEMGSPSNEILRESKDGDYDWIVIGSHGRSGLDRFFLGSVSQAVTNHAHCSVTVVRLAQTPEKIKEKHKEAAVTAKS